MTQAQRPNLPIGYWLKKADALLTAQIDAAQQIGGLSRTTWQILNVLHEAETATRAELGEPLRPFADEATVDERVRELVERGFVAGDGAAVPYKLTQAGSEAHAAALARQKAVRQRAMIGISQEDYATTVRVLQQLVHNLEENSEEGGSA